MIVRILFCAIVQFSIIGYVFGVVPQITRLNVQCDRTGMKVNVDFDNAFNGIIFSKGHYSDPNCRHVKATSARNSYEFFISSSRCGTIGTDMQRGGSPQGFKNVIIIQNDPDYQEVWDTARKLSCDWVTKLEKYVTFAPFGVDMLGVKELRFPGDTVDCWMDIQRGHGPFAPTVGGVVPIGEKLTVVIYVRDTDSSFDVHVKDCYAYDTSDYKNPDARAIKLTDENGCPVKEKLVQGFFRTRDVRNSGATVIAYGIINAFKFPERMDVFLACNVEVCKGGCPNNECQPEVAVPGEEPTTASSAGGTGTAAAGGGEHEDEDKKEEAEGSDEDKDEKPADDEDKQSDDEGSDDKEEADKDEDSGDKDEDGEKTEDEDKTEDEEKTEDADKDEDSGSGTATEETESSEDTTDKTDDEDKKEDAGGDDDAKEDKEDEEKEDEDKEEAGNGSEEKKEESGSGSEEKKDENGSEEKKDSDEQKDEQEKVDDEEEDAKKAAKLRLARIKKPSPARRVKAKSAAAVSPAKRATAKKVKKVSKAKSSNLRRPKVAKKNAKLSTKKPKLAKTKAKSSSLATTQPRAARRTKVVRRTARAPSSIPPHFARQVYNNNQLYLQQGRHIRTRRSITITNANATFPSMMHSISIISPIEDFDDKEMNAWEKLMDLEGKAEEVHLTEMEQVTVASNELRKPIAPYCFSLAILVSFSILLSAIVMILSMSFYVVCVHLNNRSGSAKLDTVY